MNQEKIVLHQYLRFWTEAKFLRVPLLLGLWLGMSGFSFSEADLSKLRVLYPQTGLSQDLAAVGNSLLRELPLAIASGDAPIIATKRQFIPSQAVLTAQTNTANLQRGEAIKINGRTFRGAWSRWREGDSWRIGVSDTVAMEVLGLELLDTDNPQEQGVRWFSPDVIYLPAKLLRPYRYLDVTEIGQQAGWSWQVEGDILMISSPPKQVQNLRQGVQGRGTRLVLDLNGPTTWQVSQAKDEAVIMLDGMANPELLKQYQQIAPLGIATSVATRVKPLISHLESGGGQVKLHLQIPEGSGMKVWTLSDRLIVDVSPDINISRNILWESGLRWRRDLISLGENRFPVTWLEVDLSSSNLTLKPIVSNAGTMEGTAPLMNTGRFWQASAAINGGFFNRDNQLPLGAIREGGRWLSSPILNRGAIAWNDSGNVKIGRLSITETVTTPTKTLPVLFHNSGYVQSGIARYSPEWGSSYTPLTDNEVIVTVENDVVTAQRPGGKVKEYQFTIPANGYLLTLRNNPSLGQDLTVGARVSLDSSTNPGDFAQYPNILGAGPVLLENGAVVVDAIGEQFSTAFNQQAASRSAIATTRDGKLIIAAIHNLPGKRGATLPQTAEIMQKLGAVNALNLDGGSSTSLYLGGQLIDRSPVTAARVHNGIGIFLKSPLFTD